MGVCEWANLVQAPISHLTMPVIGHWLATQKNPWLVPSPGFDSPGGYPGRGSMRVIATARGARGVTARVVYCFNLLSSYTHGGARSLACSHARTVAASAVAATAAAAVPTDDTRCYARTSPTLMCRRARRHPRATSPARVTYRFDLLSPSHVRGGARSLSYTRCCGACGCGGDGGGGGGGNAE